MKQILLFGLTALVVSVAAYGQTTQKSTVSDIPADWKTLNEPGYSIQYPDSFELKKAGIMSMSFALLSRQTSQEDPFRENINLMIQDLSGQNMNLDAYAKVSEEQVKSMLTKGKVIESKRIKTGNTEYHKVVYSGVQGQFNLKFEQYYWVVKGKAYILTLTCEINQFDAYKEVGEKILNSFVIK